jgi:hypothetical protein
MKKVEKNVFFLSGLPRSGSTVLSAILNQNPIIHSTSTSGLIECMGSLCSTWESSPTTIAQGADSEEIYRMLRAVVNSKYEKIAKDIIIDKNRGWVNPTIIQTMNNVLGYSPKIVATVRSTADCAASFVRIAKPNDLGFFLNNSPLIKHLKSSYASLKNSFEKNPANILFIEYDDLINDPKKQLGLIHKFLGIEEFDYNYQKIDTSVAAEQDELAWGIKNLHTISPELKKMHNIDSRDVLNQYFDSYDQPKFWIGETREYKKKKIDISVELAMRGQFEKSYKILVEAQKENPLCNKIAFNMGWYALRQNKLQEGMNNLARGRYDNCFGNQKPQVPTAMWDGHTMGTLLYFLEGGLGDQIHALKYIKDINKKGCDVIVACSPELFPIVKSCTGIKMIVDHSSVSGVYHDFWFPAMSILIALGYEYGDIDGASYVPKTHNSNNAKPVVGVRWQGNPKFEHEQNRRFPLTPFFDVLKRYDVEYISLQRDEGAEDCPDFINNVPLNNWEETRHAISKCDLVISSCTSVAHLSGAMGVPTWIIVPVLNYYLWSVPGDKTPYYDSVRLFRQKKFGSWRCPILEIKKEMDSMFEKQKRFNWRNICQRMLG